MPFPPPISEALKPGQKVCWRDPRHAAVLGWLDAYGPGPFEIVRVVDKSVQGLFRWVAVNTNLGEKEINEVWLALT